VVVAFIRREVVGDEEAGESEQQATASRRARRAKKTFMGNGRRTLAESLPRVTLVIIWIEATDYQKRGKLYLVICTSGRRKGSLRRMNALILCSTHYSI